MQRCFARYALPFVQAVLPNANGIASLLTAAIVRKRAGNVRKRAGNVRMNAVKWWKWQLRKDGFNSDLHPGCGTQCYRGVY
jgi:hypothetical protein